MSINGVTPGNKRLRAMRRLKFQDPKAYSTPGLRRIDGVFSFMVPLNELAFDAIANSIGKRVYVKNTTGSTLTKGTLVYPPSAALTAAVSGSATNNPAAGANVVILTTSGTWQVGMLVTIATAGFEEEAIITAVSAGVSITVDFLSYSHTTPTLTAWQAYEVAKAQADAGGTLAEWVLDADITNGSYGWAYDCIEVTGIDTSSFTAEAEVFLAQATAGTFVASATLRDYLSDWQQVVGIVRTSAVSGKVLFFPGNKRIKKIGRSSMTGAVVSPSSIGASQNNYNPTGLDTAFMLRLTASAAYEITGLAGGSTRGAEPLYIHNIGANTLTFKDESGSSTAANRFALTADFELDPDMVAIFQYDVTTQRWRLTAGSGSSGGVAGIIYSTGADGDLDLDGNPRSGMSGPTGNVYTLDRDIYPDELTIRATYTLKTNGFRVIGKTSITVETTGFIDTSGDAAVAEVAGAGAAANTVGGGTTGTTGDNGNGDAGAGLVDSLGGNGGGGGAGGATSGGGTNTVTAIVAADGGPEVVRAIPSCYTARLLDATLINGGAGGTAGGGDGGANLGGGGGGGGGVAVLAAPLITGAGTIRCNGGAGGNATGGNSGGGGGGGGGLLLTLSDNDITATSLTLQVNGGAAGTKTGTGVNGNAGAVGTKVHLRNI